MAVALQTGGRGCGRGQHYIQIIPIGNATSVNGAPSVFYAAYARAKPFAIVLIAACARQTGANAVFEHLADQKLQDKDREGYTLLLAMRSWEFEAFAALRR